MARSIDVVNNAGATRRGDFFELTEADWSDGFALKFFSMVRLSRAAWPHLKKSRGSVLNIIGIGGRTPEAAFTIGGSVNGACLSFTKALSDIGIRDGVQVNAINPGWIRTDRLSKLLAEEAAKHGGDLEKLASLPSREYQAGRRTRGHRRFCGVLSFPPIGLPSWRVHRRRRGPHKNDLRTLFC